MDDDDNNKWLVTVIASVPKLYSRLIEGFHSHLSVSGRIGEERPLDKYSTG